MADDHMELFLLWLFEFCQNQSLTPRVNSTEVQHQYLARARMKSLSTQDRKNTLFLMLLVNTKSALGEIRSQIFISKRSKEDKSF